MHNIVTLLNKQGFVNLLPQGLEPFCVLEMQ